MLFFRRVPQFRGYVDVASNNTIGGWVYDRSSPRSRLKVEIFSAGNLMGSARADLLRSDLKQARIGDGCYGFTFGARGSEVLDETLAVKIKGTEFWLPNSTSRDFLGGIEIDLINSPQRGLPPLRAGMSQHVAGPNDVEIARELIDCWARVSGDGRKVGAPFDYGAMWRGIVRDRHSALETLLRGSNPVALASYLVDLQKLPEGTGILQGELAHLDFLDATPEGRRAAVAPFHDMLASLAQYLGIKRVDCSEQNYVGEAIACDSQKLAMQIEQFLGHKIAPPPVFDGLFGLMLRERILHGRDIQALYAALRAISNSGKKEPEICEIGAGVGQAAYYAWTRGVRRYTIVDLPSVCAMQYFYLRKAIPGATVRFRGPGDAPMRADGIDLISVPILNAGAQIAADIILNCDSFPEMGDSICRSYFSKIAEWAPLLLSINQEGNQIVNRSGARQSVVADLLPEYGFERAYRFRSWVRRGFVEELWRRQS